MASFMQTLVVISVAVIAKGTEGHSELICPIGQEPDPEDCRRLRWVIPVSEPCRCTQLRMAGLTSRVIRRAFPVVYRDSFLVSDNATEIQEWLNCSKECTTVTPPSYGYIYLGEAIDVRRFEFKVKAGRDAHISLSPVPDNQVDQYEIVIGAGGNTYSAIRPRQQVGSAERVDTLGILDPTEFRGFWVAFDRPTGKLSVGKEGRVTPFLEWVDPSPKNVSCIGLSGYANEVVFKYPC